LASVIAEVAISKTMASSFEVIEIVMLRSHFGMEETGETTNAGLDRLGQVQLSRCSLSRRP
jgi:hypothetical protein